MKLTPGNFLTHIKNLVTGGGIVPEDGTNNASAMVSNDAGFWSDQPVLLSSVDLQTNATLTADETNARVIIVQEAVDTPLWLTFPVPRDFDETTDQLRVRVLASQLTQSTDDDVELDCEVYIKTAGSALGSDVAPAAPGTVLSTTEQWIEFDIFGASLNRGDVVNFKLITNGANDTDGEEVLIHAIEVSHRSTLVSFNELDGTTQLR